MSKLNEDEIQLIIVLLREYSNITKLSKHRKEVLNIVDKIIDMKISGKLM